MPIWAICASRQNQRINCVMTNFCLDFCIRLKFQNCQISSALDLHMRPAGIVCHWTETPVSRIHLTSFQSFQIFEFRNKRKFMPFREIFSEFNNKLVVAFYDKWRWKLSLFSLSHILLFALDAKKILLLHFRCPLECSDV